MRITYAAALVGLALVGSARSFAADVPPSAIQGTTPRLPIAPGSAVQNSMPSPPPAPGSAIQGTTPNLPGVPSGSAVQGTTPGLPGVTPPGVGQSTTTIPAGGMGGPGVVVPGR